jgi:hypothetical protein
MNRLIFPFFLSGIFILIATNELTAQNELPAMPIPEEQLEQIAEITSEEADLSDWSERFQKFLQHPLNINKASFEELIESGIFSTLQATAIIQHRERFDDYLSYLELQVVEGFDESDIRSVAPFITCGRSLEQPNANWLRMVRDGSHSFILRTTRGIENKRGFLMEDGVSKYKGDPYGIYFRYRFQFMNRLSWCLVGEKDPGEVMGFSRNVKGFDFYSGHIALRDLGSFRKLVVGDYHLAYGQGLTLNTGLSAFAGTDPGSLLKSGEGIRPYTSSGEAFFRRGTAISWRKKRVSVDAFYSSKKLDASLQTDSLGNEWISSLQESGYHRTDSEISNRNVLTEKFFGSALRYQGKLFRSGITMHQTTLSKRWQRTVHPYNQFDFSGTSLINGGFDYTWLFRNVHLFGEFSFDDLWNKAWLQGMVLHADSKVSFALLMRNYGVRYRNLHSFPLRENGGTGNEKGLYVSVMIKPVRQFILNANFDRFYFPWLSYRVNGPARGESFTTQAIWRPDRRSELYFRFRRTVKPLNSNDGVIPVAENRISHGFRIHYSKQVSDGITLRGRVEWMIYEYGQRRENGSMIYQDLIFNPRMSRITGNIRIALFETESYDSRIYAYENDVLYGYSIPAYYYSGSRVYSNTRIKLFSGLDIWIKYGVTFYRNRKSIGSGWDEIQGSRKSDVRFQLVWNPGKGKK